MKLQNWWKSFFTSSVYPLKELTNDRDTKQEVRELLRRLPVPNGAEILDVGCGLGRHSLLLAKRGYRMTGVDFSASYLADARRRAKRQKISARFLKRDMRDLGFASEFDAAINLWTSFGYFPRYLDDLKTLRSIRAALRPRGFLAMELVDGRRLFTKNLRRKTWAKTGRYWSLEDRHLKKGSDPALLSERIYIGPDGRVRRGKTFVRMYTRARLAAALRKAGFARTIFSAGLSGGARSGRIFVLARREG